MKSNKNIQSWPTLFKQLKKNIANGRNEYSWKEYYQLLKIMSEQINLNKQSYYRVQTTIVWAKLAEKLHFNFLGIFLDAAECIRMLKRPTIIFTLMLKILDQLFAFSEKQEYHIFYM